MTKTQGYADLPAELVRHIFADAGDQQGARLSVVDRLRAEATCRAWRRALRGLPFHTLDLDRYCGAEGETKQQWAIVVQPPAKIVEFYFNRSAVLLHSLDRKAVEELELSEQDLLEDLPHPDMFPNLRVAVIDNCIWDPAWLARLGQLRRLEYLQVSHASVPWEIAQQRTCLVSGLSTLTSLGFHVNQDDFDLEDDDLALCIDLPTLPSLLELRLGFGGTVELRTTSTHGASSSGHLNSVRHLELDWALSAAVDFAALPALNYLELRNVHRLPGATTIAGAASLRRLVLNGYLEADEEGDLPLARPWVLELLRHAPPSLRSLQLCGDWAHAVAEVLAGLTQLRALEVDSEDAVAALRLGDGPVWGHLHALGWACKVPLPKAVRQATRLELLQYRPPAPLTLHDLHLLSSLPALRHLRLCPSRGSAEEDAEVATDLARRLIPRLETLEFGDMRWKPFVEASAGFLLG